MSNLLCHVCRCSPGHKDHEYSMVGEVRLYLSLDNPHAYQPDPKEVIDFMKLEASNAEIERQNSATNNRAGLGDLRLHGSGNLALRTALQRLYDENADYIRINNLGDVHHNQAMKDARDALSIPAAQPAPSASSLDEIAEYLDEQGVPFMEPLQSDSCPMAYTMLERVKMLRAAQPAPGWISDLQLAAELLEQMYEKWENGDPCFSDSDDSMGNAFLLGDLEDKIVDVLNRLFPRKAAPPGPAQGKDKA